VDHGKLATDSSGALLPKSHFSIPFVVDRLREDFYTDKFCTGHAHVDNNLPFLMLFEGSRSLGEVLICEDTPIR
jgi:hypothetical protein